ncbi:hypothetical protein KPL35_14715 [Clostridium sp. CF011]|nr:MULTISPECIES: hypothetical protein [unclassified Clostridium]MBU3093319.1 hypothetical protein [Clostridium sp. CF011]MBW9146729.1 hypothetical protein [Clostridium sp. CM027]UVE42611.1 hypothetical protein KTC92_03780 [Clostridium sp. CM027]WAG70605.1 hypothetical protein LL036_03950 [Clostridium sp. CF011]
MSKNCIFNNKKICNSCGECEVCELNSNKKCNNCGKCLEMEGYDVKAIKIDEVFEDNEIEGVEEVDENICDRSEINLAEEVDNDENENDELPKLEDYDSVVASDEFLKLHKDEFIPENNEVWEFIDDIDGAKELLENEDDNSGLLQEEFPGLIRLKKI